MGEHTRLHPTCLLRCRSTRPLVKSPEHRPKPSPTPHSPCGRTIPTAIPFLGISRLKSWKTATAMECQMSCLVIMIQATQMHPALWKTLTMITTDFPTPTNQRLAPIRSTQILTATACATDLWLRHRTALLALTPSRLTLLATPIQTATAIQTRSILLRTATLLWLRIWTMTVTVLMTSMKPTRALTTVQPTLELTRSTLTPTTTVFATVQSMSMILKATSSVLLDLTIHRLAKLLKGLCMA